MNKTDEDIITNEEVRKMTKEEAQKILKSLGITFAAAVRDINSMVGTKYRTRDSWPWLKKGDVKKESPPIPFCLYLAMRKRQMEEAENKQEQ